MSKEIKLQKRTLPESIDYLLSHPEKYSLEVRGALMGMKTLIEIAKKELLVNLEMVWAAEYEEYGRKRYQLWPLDKQYWGKKGYEKYKPYVDPWKTAEALLRWLGNE